MAQSDTEREDSPIVQAGTGIGAHTLFSVVQNPSLTISVGKTHVTIKPDGTIVYGEGYTPDEAAKAFWDALGYERTQRKPSGG